MAPPGGGKGKAEPRKAHAHHGDAPGALRRLRAGRGAGCLFPGMLDRTIVFHKNLPHFHPACPGLPGAACGTFLSAMVNITISGPVRQQRI